MADEDPEYSRGRRDAVDVELRSLTREVRDLKAIVTANYVTRDQLEVVKQSLEPNRLAVYGAIGLLLSALLVAIAAGVLK